MFVTFPEIRCIIPFVGKTPQAAWLKEAAAPGMQTPGGNGGASWFYGMA